MSRGIRYTVAVAIAVLVGACGETGEPPTTVGTIAFIRATPDEFPPVGPIMVMSADGSGEQRITQLSTSQEFDRSVDGKRLTYDGLKDSVTGNEGIYVADVATAKSHRLDVDDCYGPVISDDGTQVACNFTEPNVIKVVSADANDARTLTPDCCLLPSWSPDGTKIAYMNVGLYNDDGELTGPTGVFVMNADGTDKRLVAKEEWSDDQAPQWSPNGQTLAFLSQGIWVVPAAGGRARRIVSNAETATKDVAWSPDGARLAYTRGDGDFEIWVVNSDGSDARRLTDNKGVQDESPSWSPDGTALAFTSSRDGNYEIYTMNADGSGQRRVTSNEVDDIYPIWSGQPE